MTKKKQKSKTINIYRLSAGGVLALLLLLTVSTCYLLMERNNQADKVASLNGKVAALQEDAEFKEAMLYNEIDQQKSLMRPALLPGGDKLFIPELEITLPYNAVTKTLQYSSDVNGYVGVTSTMITDHKTRQLSCSMLISVSATSAPPRSPWEEAAGEIKLSDGRTLYVLAAKAFKNNEASTEECATQVWHQITPRQVADEFAKAQAY